MKKKEGLYGQGKVVWIHKSSLTTRPREQRLYVLMLSIIVCFYFRSLFVILFISMNSLYLDTLDTRYKVRPIKQ